MSEFDALCFPFTNTLIWNWLHSEFVVLDGPVSPDIIVAHLFSVHCFTVCFFPNTHKPFHFLISRLWAHPTQRYKILYQTWSLSACHAVIAQWILKRWWKKTRLCSHALIKLYFFIFIQPLLFCNHLITFTLVVGIHLEVNFAFNCGILWHLQHYYIWEMR